MNVLQTISRRARRAQSTRKRAPVGLVPTMGALHAGHVSLFRAARAECDTVVASVFVNPAQFGDPADLERYPRDEARDAAVAENAGVDLLFAPDGGGDLSRQASIPGSTSGRSASILEGAFRPGHFRGVATVCLKLFNIVRPDVAYFGQKDAQQVQVIRQMIRDLHLRAANSACARSCATRMAWPSRRETCASVPPSAQRALALPRALATGDADAARALLAGSNVDYVEVAPFDPPVLAAAVRVGPVRLIDNAPLTREQP